MPRRAPRPTVESLSDRIVPAFDLAIDGDLTTFNVNSTFAAGTTTFSATGTGATLDVADIAAALNFGNVVISTGAGGAQPGDIDWAFDSQADDLFYFGPAARNLTLRPSASATNGDVSITGATLSFDDNVGLTIDTTLPAADGDVVMTDFTSVFSANSVVVNAAIVQLPGYVSTVSGSLAVTATSILPSSTSFLSAGTTATLAGPVNLGTGALNILAGTTASVAGTVNGAGDLTIGGELVTLGGTVGGGTPLHSLTFASGVVSAGTNPIAATSVAIGDGDPFFGEPAVLGVASGAVTGTVTVNSDGVLAPGGTGTAGTFSVTGALLFNGGTYRLDVGAVSDQVMVTGDVSISAGSTLGDAGSTGVLTAADGEKKVLDFGGTLSGTFDNAPAEGAKFLFGGDALDLSHYGPAASGVTVRQAGREPNNAAAGSDADGTGYTVKLAGPGDLIRARDAFAGLVLVLRNTTDKSTVTMGTKVNASDDVVGLAGVSVTGHLGSFVAKKVNLDGPFTATGSVKALAFATVVAPITLGGSAADKTTLTAAAAFGEITSPGTLSVTTTGAFGADVNANAVGTVKVGGTLFGTGPTWDITTGITSITAAEIQGFSVDADYLGRLVTTGGGPNRVAGDIANSAFVLDGSSGGFGLKTLTAEGNVRNSRFDVMAGNVSAVTVGRFINSHLYLRYIPGIDFTAGTFTGEATLTKFTTTAKVLGDATHPLNWAFAGSQVAASTLGSIRLSGLKTANGADPAGFKFSTAGGSIQTTASDAPAAQIPLKANLTPGAIAPIALSGDFFYFDTTP